jgi:drug/metabolite transporter (DMT)-like permease
MGLVQTLIDEIIPLPKHADYESIGNKQMVCVYRLGYSFLNLIFQTIDCIVIPFFVFSCFVGHLDFGWLNWIIIIVGGLFSIFSLSQCFYYFLIPAEKYLHPLHGRIFGETAIGAFIAALFKVKIITYVE